MRDLPTIIVLGSSSAGKSALIDRLFATTRFAVGRQNRIAYEPTIESLYVRCCGVTLTRQDVDTIMDRNFLDNVDLSNVHGARRTVRYELTIDPRFSRDLHNWRCGAKTRDSEEKFGRGGGGDGNDDTIDCFVAYQLYDTSGDVCRRDDSSEAFRNSPKKYRKRFSLGGGERTTSTGTTIDVSDNNFRKTSIRRSLSQRRIVRNAIAAIERHRETLRLKYIRRADVLILVYDPTDEDSVCATLTCLGSRTKTSSAKIVLIFENFRRRENNDDETKSRREDEFASSSSYHRSLRFFCRYENIADSEETATHSSPPPSPSSFSDKSTARLFAKRPFEATRYFYSCDLANPSSGTIVREAIRVAMKRVILERYILTGWSSEIIREAVRGLNDVRDCSVDVVDNAVTDSTSERRRRNDRCRGDDGDDEDDGRFISIVSNKVPSWRPTSRRHWRLLRKNDFRSFFTRIVKLLRKKYKLRRRRRSAGERKRDVVETRST